MKLYALLLLILIGAFVIYPFNREPLPSVPKGTIERIDPFHSEFVSSRYLDVWLPEGYSTDQKYDVLYMHDGKMLFDGAITWNQQEWQIDEVASDLMAQHKVRPFIVVGIPNAGSKRHSEFFPQQPFASLTPEQQRDLYEYKGNSDSLLFASKVSSDNYLKFLVKEVIPYIDSHYSVHTGGAHRYLGGSSMGGLISWYGLMEYPDEFGGAICISTHWPGASSQDELIFQTFLTYIDKHLPLLTTQKLYFDHGDQTLDAMYQPYQQKIDQLLIQRQFPAKQWHSEFFPGENHSERSWAKRLHIPLEFMFGRQSGQQSLDIN